MSSSAIGSPALTPIEVPRATSRVPPIGKPDLIIERGWFNQHRRARRSHRVDIDLPVVTSSVIADDLAQLPQPASMAQCPCPSRLSCTNLHTTCQDESRRSRRLPQSRSGSATVVGHPQQLLFLVTAAGRWRTALVRPAPDQRRTSCIRADAARWRAIISAMSACTSSPPATTHSPPTITRSARCAPQITRAARGSP